jgi:Domain of unknown function (DUF1963)
MGKRMWLLWSSGVLTSTLLGLLMAVAHVRDVAQAEKQRAKWPQGVRFVDTSFMDQQRRSSEVFSEQMAKQWTPEISNQILHPGFFPPAAGNRELADPYDTRDLPRTLRDSLERLEAAKRVEVSWNEPTAKATLQQTDDSFRLTLVSLKNPQASANVVTVANKVAYIEDHGEDFSLPLARFRLPNDGDLVLPVKNQWWKKLATSYQDRSFRLSALPGGAAITEFDAESSQQPIRYTVSDGNFLKSFETENLPHQIGKVTYQFSTSVQWKSIEVPTWASASTGIPMTWDEILPQGKPDWTEPVVRITQVKQSSDNILGSQCGSPPFTPETLPSGKQTLPTGAAFRCQINLADVPQTIGLPASGLLQFFTVNEFESGFVRYFPEIDASTHNATRALNVAIDEMLEPTSLSFTAAQTATSYDDVRTRAPRSLRFLRGPNGYPLINSVENDPDLVTALTRRGVNYVANDVDLMGGHWDANGATPDGFTRLFMITDDVGYAYWHIPTTDLAAARFDRVVGGWTD